MKNKKNYSCYHQNKFYLQTEPSFRFLSKYSSLKHHSTRLVFMSSYRKPPIGKGLVLQNRCRTDKPGPCRMPVVRHVPGPCRHGTQHKDCLYCTCYKYPGKDDFEEDCGSVCYRPEFCVDRDLCIECCCWNTVWIKQLEKRKMEVPYLKYFILNFNFLPNCAHCRSEKHRFIFFQRSRIYVVQWVFIVGLISNPKNCGGKIFNDHFFPYQGTLNRTRQGNNIKVHV